MAWMRSWKIRRARRRAALTPPSPPAPERLEEARQAARDAEAVLGQVLNQAPAVEERAAKAERIHRENNLGPRFWAAVESMTGRHA